jgi:hypothetical protein
VRGTLTEFVVQNDRSVGGISAILHGSDKGLIIRIHILGCYALRANFPVILNLSEYLCGRCQITYRVIAPYDCRQVETGCDQSDSVIHIPIRRSPAGRSDAEDLFDHLTGVV